MNSCRLIVVFCVLSCWSASASAISIFLTGPAQVSTGDLITLDFWLDNTDEPLLGGGTDVSYDASLVSFVDFSFNPDLLCGAVLPTDPCAPNTLDPFFSVGPVDDGAGLLSFISFGNFDLLAENVYRIGTLSFEAIGLGLASFVLDPDSPAGWASGLPPFLGIDLTSIDLGNVDVNIVAEPPVLLLLIGGLVLLTARLRRQ